MSLLLGVIAAPPAHEGHGRAEWQSSALHWLLEPEHAVPAAVVLACAIAVSALRRRARRQGAPPPAIR